MPPWFRRVEAALLAGAAICAGALVAVHLLGPALATLAGLLYALGGGG